MSREERKYSRITALAVCMLIVAAVLFSSFFITREAVHHCTGDDCEICLFIRFCENSLRRLGDGAAAGSVSVLFIILSVLPVLPYTASVLSDTPISRKVRIND